MKYKESFMKDFPLYFLTNRFSLRFSLPNKLSILIIVPVNNFTFIY